MYPSVPLFGPDVKTTGKGSAGLKFNDVAPGGCVLVYASTQDTIQSNELAKQDEIQISRYTYQVPGLEQTHTIECAERRQA